MKLGVAARSKDSFISELWCSRASYSYGFLKLTDRAQTTLKWDFCVSPWETVDKFNQYIQEFLCTQTSARDEGFVNSPLRW